LDQQSCAAHLSLLSARFSQLAQQLAQSISWPSILSLSSIVADSQAHRSAPSSTSSRHCAALESLHQPGSPIRDGARIARPGPPSLSCALVRRGRTVELLVPEQLVVLAAHLTPPACTRSSQAQVRVPPRFSSL
jgi:hypothetical protein